MRSLFKMLFAAILTVSLCGCGEKPDAIVSEQPADDHAGHDHDEHAEAEGQHASHDHGGWWCTEHGVPEGECALCDTSLIADFKAKDDWCDEHSRPDSQCFTCNPENLDKFAARYEAKFGEQPPKPTE